MSRAYKAVAVEEAVGQEAMVVGAAINEGHRLAVLQHSHCHRLSAEPGSCDLAGRELSGDLCGRPPSGLELRLIVE